MEFTGEQVVPGVSKQRLIDEDIGRYAFAQTYAEGKRVLDIASGTGLGTAMLAERAAEVTGVDISAESVAYAKAHHGAPNTTYVLGSATDTSLFAPQSFDVIISYETIEHLEAPERSAYLANLASWLRPEGVLLLSTPNKRVTSPFREKPDNQFHVLEFTRAALLAEVEAYFIVDSVRGQRTIPRFATIRLVRRFVHLIARITGRLRTLYILSGGPQVVAYDPARYEPRIFVLVCRPRVS